MSEAARTLDEPDLFNDALVYGDVSEAILSRGVSMAFSKAGAKTAPGRWRNVVCTVRDVLNHRLTVHPEAKDKDGECMLSGSIVGYERRTAAVDVLYWMALDLDTGEDMDRVRERIQSLGLFAVLHTSWSNGKDTTDVKKEAVFRFLGNNATDATRDEVCEYLGQVKRYRPHVLDTAEMTGTVQTGDGFQYRVRHASMTKLRVWFLLAEPFRFADRGATHTIGTIEWKERYRGMARLLDVATDRACVDPARLWYLPRHPGGAQWRCEVVAGRALDIGTLPRVTDQDERRAGLSPYEQGAAEMTSGNYQTRNIAMFAARYADRFQAEMAMLDLEPDGDRGHRASGAGRTHRCPGDDDHTNAGDELDSGFFVVNADDSNSDSFVMHCRHDACAGRDRLALLDLFCVQHGIADAMELRRWVPAIDGDEEETAKPEQDEKAAHRAYKNPAEAKRAIAAVGKGDAAAAVLVAGNVAVSGFSKADEDVLRKALSKQSGVGVEALKGDMRTARKQATAESDQEYVLENDALSDLEKVNEKYAVVKLGDKVLVLEEPKKQGHSPSLMTAADFATWMRPHKIVVGNSDGSRKLVPLSKVWIEWAGRRQYSAVVFEPEGDEPDEYNMYKGLAVEPRKGSWDLMRDHVLNNICVGDEANFNWLMTWLAQMFQQPGTKLGSAIVIKGKKGTGKSFLFDWVRKALGVHALKVNNKTLILSHFNSHQQCLILLVCEEAFWAGDKESGGVLKDLITSDEMVLTKKGKDSIRVSNYTRLVMVSNEDWIAPVSLDDERRYFVLQCGTEHMQDTAYFKRIAEQMDNGGLEAMIHDLLHWQPPYEEGWEVLRNPPKTTWLTEQGEESMPPWEQFFYQLVDDGEFDIPNRPDDIHPILLHEDEENLIPQNDLRWFYNTFLQQTASGRRKVGDHKLLARLVGEWLLAGQRLVRSLNPNGQISVDSRPRCHRLPGLATIREALVERKRLDIHAGRR